MKSKFIFAGLSICIVSLCIASATSYLISYNIISKEINAKAREATHKFVNQINTFFVENGKELHSIVENKEIHDHNGKFLKRYLNGKYQRLKDNDSPIIDIYVGFTDKKC